MSIALAKVLKIGVFCCLAGSVMAAQCDKTVRAEPVEAPGFAFSSVSLSGPSEIKNGSSADYTVTVNIERNHFQGEVFATLELQGEAGVSPLNFAGALARDSVTIPAGQSSSPPATLVLRCVTPFPPAPGNSNTLAGNVGNSGHGGQTPGVACQPNCCPHPGGSCCPPGCGQQGMPPCPSDCTSCPVGCGVPCLPGCGQPIRDPVTVTARVASSSPIVPTQNLREAGWSTTSINVLCVP